MLIKAVSTILSIGFLAIAGGAVAQQSYPDDYPANYAEIVEASKGEENLLIYTNLAVSQWQPAIDKFAEKYPWVQVDLIDLASDAYARFYAETSSQTRTADMLVAGGEDNWHEFIAKGHLMPYVSPESGDLPDWSHPTPGLYTVASDPAVLIYNKQLLSEDKVPTSIHGVAELVASDPSLKGRIAAHSVARPFGRAIHWAWFNANPDAFDVYEKLAPFTRTELTAAPLLEKVTTGEYVLSWLVSGAVVFEKMKNPAYKQLIGYRFMMDGTPLVPRRIAIPNNSRSVNSAKLMTDFLVSKDGQKAIAQNGATPYRSDVEPEAVPFFTFDMVAKDIGGKDKMLVDVYEPGRAAERDAFLTKWKGVFTSSN